MNAVQDDIARSPLTYALLGAGIALAFALVALHVVNKTLLGDGTMLALDQDANLPSWLTAVLFAVAGLACWLLARMRDTRRAALVLLGLIAVGLSFEQTVQLHGELEQEGGDVVMLVVQPLLAVGFVAVVALAARDLPHRSRLLLVGMVAAIAVAQGSSMLNSRLDLPYAGIVVVQTLEELAEMSTAILLLAALAQPLVDAVVARVLRERAAAPGGV